jgi:predicted ATPase/class 3 adenylate cyclase
VTFLFTDIEGSTKLAQAFRGDRWTTILARHREIIRTALAAANGHEEKTEGDGFLAVFGRPADAVRAAADAQRRLAAEPWPDDAAVRVRMGLHSGDGALDADGEYVGADVHRAARVGAAGHGGQVLLSETTSSLVADELPDGVTIRGLGEHRLKDLRPERLCQLVIDTLQNDFPPIRSLDRQPNNLPTQLTSFVGRDAELADAAALLPRTRLLTLTGPGGTGKTRLSLQLAANVADQFEDGTWFVALEPVRDPSLVASRIATVLGLVETGKQSARDLIVESLGSRHVLFVLDNFEQVVEAAPLVADLLRSCERLTVIATSRAALRVSGEQEYPVPGLPAPRDLLAMSDLEKLNLPVGQRGLAAEGISQYEAVRLFIARAVAVRPDFMVTNENAPAVAGICSRLHGMPLAIELAAARIKLLTPEAILVRLEHQLGVLAAGARDVPERQQTLRGAIAWSYDLLGEGERRLLGRVAVFVGGCNLEIAEAVCGPADEIGSEVVDGLMSLADQSLVKVETVGGETRFRQLDTIHEFAREQLVASGEAAEIERRHAVAFVELAEATAPALAGDRQREALGRLERDHDNIRAVLDRATAAGDADTAIRIGFAMWRYWQKRGHLVEARRRLLAIADQPWSRSDPVLRARLMEALGGVGWWQADRDILVSAYTEALEIWRSIGDKREIANALYNSSFQYAIAVDPTASDPDGIGIAYMEESLALYREVGDEHGIANALWGIGNYRYFHGDPNHGVPEAREALTLYRRLGDQTMEAWSLHMIATGVLRTGKVAEATENSSAAIRLFHAAGDVAGITLGLDDLAGIASAAGDLPRAARLWGAARALSSASGVGLADLVDSQVDGASRPSARSAMDPAVLERYALEGRQLSVDEAVAYALEIPIDDLPGPHQHVGGTRG